MRMSSRRDRPSAVPTLLTMRWERLAMVHWSYEATAIQPLLPKGLIVDRFDGRAWVSLTPFMMARVRGLGLVPMPPSVFPETNLRTYVRLPDGRSGLWFFCLDVAPSFMLAARAIGVPYRLAELSLRVRSGETVYTGRRRGSQDIGYRLRVREGALVDKISPLDEWLTSRWAAFSLRAGRLWLTPVRHEPWTLRHGTIVELRQTLTRGAGLPDPEAAPLVRLSPGVGPVRLGPPRPVS